MKKTLCAIALASLLALGTSACTTNHNYGTEQANNNYKIYLDTTLNELEETIEPKEYYLVIDLRDKSDYQKGHVKHAINIEAKDLANYVDLLQQRREDNIVVYADTLANAKDKALFLSNNIKDKLIYVANGTDEYQYTLYKQNNVLCSDLLAAQNQDILILDAREKVDYDKGHLQGAVNVHDAILTDDLIAKIKKLSNNGQRPIYTHCYRGNNGNKLATALVQLGYTDVTNSIDGSKECVFPVK